VIITKPCGDLKKWSDVRPFSAANFFRTSRSVLFMVIDY